MLVRFLFWIATPQLLTIAFGMTFSTCNSIVLQYHPRGNFSTHAQVCTNKCVEITSAPESISVNKGETATLDCEVSDGEVIWFKEGEEVFEEENIRLLFGIMELESVSSNITKLYWFCCGIRLKCSTIESQRILFYTFLLQDLRAEEDFQTADIGGGWIRWGHLHLFSNCWQQNWQGYCLHHW